MNGKIHNIGILAHVDSGKTTLTEQLLYLTGAIRRAGSVDAGTAATDSLSVEKQRGISVRTATASTEWNGVTVNIIDTPGHIDFAGEVERALSALDYAVVIVSAVEGVRAHTENILKSLDTAKLPRMIFINKIDRAGSDVSSVINELRQISSQTHLVLSEVVNEGEETAAVKAIESQKFVIAATETLADICDEAADVFLNDGVLSESHAKELIRKEIAACRLTPVVFGSAKYSIGIKELADLLTEFMPSSERRATDELCGIIFKIEHDKTLGKVSHIRLFGGEISNRDEVEIFSPESKTTVDSDAVETEKKPPIKEKISQIKKFSGAKYTDSGIVKSGDIAAVCGLPGAKTGHFIGSLAVSDCAKLVNPFLRVKVTPSDSDPLKIPALAQALSELSDEEPYIDAKWENGQKEITINTTGKIQLEVLGNLLNERYGISANFSPPTVIYKETPAGTGYARASYTMPKPCWAVVEFLFEPMPRGYGVSYHGKLPSNQCFYRYQSHIRTSFNNCLEQGLYGWEVTDFKCTLVGGEHHTIHTHPLDFFVCTPMAFMNGLSQIGSTILEPLLKIRITAPEEISGKIFSEIIKMGGEYDSPVIHSQIVTLEAIVPVATSMDFPAKLAVISSGKAVLSQSFYGYRECRDGLEHINPRRGVNPLDRSKWILFARGAYQTE
ncbi:MAG: TetM/TetW/TetO/TetS family tetracycline resistance ribosomal protection protein [Clostridia bacterium]|nr:TetM/TetW/TetO/TetS family tetracycline resistance ribosomal protection protein [Clostridia bacterium]MBR3819111.1 TetM/TetW/TetO/TetS family tetracycline resistance ribosomal protection protein [Clostridia bacterium]